MHCVRYGDVAVTSLHLLSPPFSFSFLLAALFSVSFPMGWGQPNLLGPPHRPPSTPKQSKMGNYKHWEPQPFLSLHPLGPILSGAADTSPCRAELHKNALHKDFVAQPGAFGLGCSEVPAGGSTDRREMPGVLEQELEIGDTWQHVFNQQMGAMSNWLVGCVHKVTVSEIPSS